MGVFYALDFLPARNVCSLFEGYLEEENLFGDESKLHKSMKELIYSCREFAYLYKYVRD
jgi:hypothetical protein